MNGNLAGTFEPGAHPLRLNHGAPTAAATRPLCVLDGHLDNAGEIRAELSGATAGASVEELLAAAYRRWRADLPGRMRGDFVLLLWDEERGDGLIARDQLGARPLYLHESGGTLLFANEIDRLLAMLPRRPGPDPASVAHWLARSNRPGGHTLYEGVRRLEPGTMLLLDRRGFRAARYWAPRFEEPLELPAEQLATQLREALERSVARRTGAGGPTGVLMSGGLDSSSVAAVCARLEPRRTRAYSGTFPDHPAVDETELIAELRTALDLPGATASVRPGGLLSSALRYLATWQMPLLSWGDFWTLPLMRTAVADGVETVLDGTGGDELFGPFPYFLADRLRAGHPLQTVALARELPGGGPHVSRRQVAAVLRSLALAGALPYGLQSTAQRPFARRGAPRWLRRRAVGDLVRSDDPLAWKRLDGPRWWAHAAHGIAYGIEQSGVMDHKRRWEMTAGVQARHPLLDLDLVRLALRQPPRQTFDRRFNRPLLRAGMAGLLPDSVRLRPAKAWFDSLIVDCLTGPDGAAIRHILTDPAAELGAYVDLDGMRSALLDSDTHRDEDPLGWMWQVWRLLTAELWLRSQSSPAMERPLVPAPSSARVEIEVARASYLSRT